MSGILISLWAEALKIRKSKIFWFTIVLFAFIPCMMGLLMFVQKYPEIAGKLGMIGTKSSMVRFGEPSWSNYLTLLSESIAAIGLIGYGFTLSWTFGREYSDHTVKDILALPVSRTKIVLSKFLAIVVWCILLTCIFLIFAIILGKIIHLSDWSQEIVFQNISRFTITSFLTILLSSPVAFFASFSRGYLLPMGFVILTLIMANFTGLVGLGPYFPWAIPGIFSTPAGAEGMHLKLVSYIILFSTSLTGFTATILYWLYADQK
jgi:ABC-2 type transport system permease protein